MWEKRKWFRRPNFPMAPNRQPKWHLLEDAELGSFGRSRRVSIQYQARCGYFYNFERWGSGPLTRDEIKSPGLQCAKCVKAEAKRQDLLNKLYLRMTTLCNTL